MKKIIVLSVLICLCATAWSQDTTRINLYTGIVGSGFVSIDSGKITNAATLRIAARIKERISDHLSFDGWVGYETSGDILIRSSVILRYKNYGVSAGYQPTPMSEMKPYPLSVDGQFQFTAEAMPPSGTIGMSAWYKNLKLGLYMRNRNPEYHATYVTEVFSTGIWMSDKKFGGMAIKVKLPRLYMMTSVLNGNSQGMALAIQPIKKIPYKLVWDLAAKDKKLYSNLVGFLQTLRLRNSPPPDLALGMISLINQWEYSYCLV